MTNREDYIYSYVYPALEDQPGFIVVSSDSGSTWTQIAESFPEYGMAIAKSLNYRPDMEHAHCDEMLRSIIRNYEDLNILITEFSKKIETEDTSLAVTNFLQEYQSVLRKHEPF